MKTNSFKKLRRIDLAALTLILASTTCVAAVLLRIRPFWITSKPEQLAVVPIKLATLLTPRSFCLGDLGARDKVVVFRDYQCPPCHSFWSELEKLSARHPNSLAVFFRNFPLVEIHADAFDAAVLAEGSKQLSSFPKLHRAFFKAKLDSKSISAALASIGLSRSRLSSFTIGSRRHVLADMDLAHDLNIAGTPTVFYVEPKKPSTALDHYPVSSISLTGLKHEVGPASTLTSLDSLRGRQTRTPLATTAGSLKGFIRS